MMPEYWWILACRRAPGLLQTGRPPPQSLPLLPEFHGLGERLKPAGDAVVVYRIGTGIAEQRC